MNILSYKNKYKKYKKKYLLAKLGGASSACSSNPDLPQINESIICIFKSKPLKGENPKNTVLSETLSKSPQQGRELDNVDINMISAFLNKNLELIVYVDTWQVLSFNYTNFDKIDNKFLQKKLYLEDVGVYNTTNILENVQLDNDIKKQGIFLFRYNEPCKKLIVRRLKIHDKENLKLVEYLIDIEKFEEYYSLTTNKEETNKI